MIDIDAATQRLIDAYDATDTETRRLGAAWYPNAQAMCAAMVRTSFARDGACGVVAALSPRNGWAQNLAQAAAVLAAKRQRKGCPRVHTTAMRAQAWRIAGGADPLDVLNGPKVRAFYRNLTGDSQAVTVDVWAARAALGVTDVPPITPKVYADIAHAYWRAAMMRGVDPSTLQATVWIDIRGKAN
jgi:hypothetical protein